MTVKLSSGETLIGKDNIDKFLATQERYAKNKGYLGLISVYNKKRLLKAIKDER